MLSMDVLQRHHSLSKPAQNEFLRNPLVFAPGATNLFCQLTTITKVHDQAMDTVLEGYNKTEHWTRESRRYTWSLSEIDLLISCFRLLPVPSSKEHLHWPFDLQKPHPYNCKRWRSNTYLNIPLGLETCCHDHPVRLRGPWNMCICLSCQVWKQDLQLLAEHLCKNCHGTGRHRGDAKMLAIWLLEICWIHLLYAGRWPYKPWRGVLVRWNQWAMKLLEAYIST